MIEIIKLNRILPANQAAIQVDIGWLKLMQFVQAHPYSELKVVFKNGIPVMIEKGIENIKLSL